MPNVYVEPRPKGRPEGTAITDYVLEFAGDRPVDGRMGSRLVALEPLQPYFVALVDGVKQRGRTRRVSPSTRAASLLFNAQIDKRGRTSNLELKSRRSGWWRLLPEVAFALFPAGSSSMGDRRQIGQWSSVPR